MAHRFCDHLDEYGAQYVRTEASYKQCVSLLDRMMSSGPMPDLVDLVTKSIAEWSTEDQKLREMLVAAVRSGQVRVPAGILNKASEHRRREAKKAAHPVCSKCRFPVPRLTYPEWQFAFNGAVSFRGEEVPVSGTDLIGH